MSQLTNARWARACAFGFCAAVSLNAANAQTAFRCDVNGATVYSEKPCADGKAVAPTQDTDAQRARAKEATAQVKADNQAVDARIDKRASDEAKARAADRSAVARSDRAEASAAKKRVAKARAAAAKTKVAKAKASKAKPTKPVAGAQP